MTEQIKTTIIQKISVVYISIIVVITIIFGAWGLVYVLWNKHVASYVDNHGDLAVATIIDINNRSGFVFDVKYEGEYYVVGFSLKRKDRKRFNLSVGERCYARLWPEKMKYQKYHHLWIPSYVRIVLQPLPIDQQDYEWERARIDSMYHKSKSSTLTKIR